MKQVHSFMLVISFLFLGFAYAEEKSYLYKEELENFKNSPEYDLIFNEDVDPMLRAFNADIENYKELTYWQQLLRAEILSHGTVVVTPTSMPKLYAYVDALCKKAAIQTPTIFITTREGFLNAMAMRLLNSTGAIVIGQKMLKKSCDIELEAIIAHEIGHIKYNHSNKILALLIGNFAAVNAFEYFILQIRNKEMISLRTIINLQFTLFAASLMTNFMINKKFEKQADMFAYKEMGKAEGLSMFLRELIEKENKYNADLDATYANLQANESKMSRENYDTLKWNFNVMKWIVGAYKWIYHNTPYGAHPGHELRIETIQAYLDEKAEKQEINVQ